jgi:hypothetical protein
MDFEYSIIQQNGQSCGELRFSICENYESLAKKMVFVDDEQCDRDSCSAPLYSQHFLRQLPTKDVYPVAFLEDLNVHPNLRKMGIAHQAMRAWRVLISEYHARLGWLRIGTSVGEDYYAGMQWRKKFYESEGWVSFQSPPPPIILVWMYHLLPPLRIEEGASIIVVLKKVEQESFWGRSNPQE